MKKLWMSGAAAVMAVSIAGVGAQTPQQPPQTQPPATTQPPTTQQPAAQTPETAENQNMVTRTIQGCVYKEEAVPGRTPNVAERAGVLEDYILVASNDTSAATAGTAGTSGTTTPPATAPAATAPPATTPPAATAGTTGAAGARMSGHKAFKLEKISDDRLRAVVGKRVEVTGRIDAEHGDTKHRGHTGATAGTATGTTGTAAAPAKDRSVGPDKIELPEFEVTSIREIAGTCPATPDIRK